MANAHNIKFKDINSVEELRTRIHNGFMSVGNKMEVVRKFGSTVRVSKDQIETIVSYTPQHGVTAKKWFI